ncbi:hypothetical protein [Arthrobacter sp. ISL-72]|uniref:hypothetical protein n=1 Tax=Arthrobacter sp. ISL-72 TaxID=2819114 RepID=UPI001BE92C38|nr:hypothetical protein [Arthrobacter sp. ISL-72]MBT2594257.1 hypothetical protein [Arthrobacter sp. ISL-72]
MTADTVRVSGVPRTVATVTLGSVASGSTSLRTVTTAEEIQDVVRDAAWELTGDPSDEFDVELLF